ncbi:MAG: OmpA family protein [Treponema sp.]|nr:OmpA family protein [Treponema sp.]
MVNRKAKEIFILFLILGSFFITVNASGEVFEYKHRAGDRYRILSVVNQEVYINRVLNHRAETLNRIAVEVTEIKNNRGVHKALFQTSERATYAPGVRRTSGTGLGSNTTTGFQWSQEYESVFERDRLGYLTIDPKYYMPVVRNVPVFPGRDLKPGDTWSADGHEMHDFREGFGIEQPYRIPFTAYYTYLGIRQWKGKDWPAFSIYYRIISRPQAVRGRVWPTSITGSFDQLVYWDTVNGHPVAYEETFSLTFELSNRNVFEFRGSAQAEIIESEYMDRDRIVNEIIEEVQRLGIQDVNVTKVEEGISISLEDIGFYADSAVMLPGEREKLEKIAEILKHYPDRDIMVGGHTALAGTSEARMQLSIERATAVTDFLLARQVRSADRIVIRGYGGEKPIADNSTEAGRRRNRRVEITLLEN